MKLLIDAHCFDTRASEGINTYLKGIYNEMPALAPDIDFYFASQRGEGLREIFGTAPNIHYVKLGEHGRAVRMLREYPRLLRRLGIDWAHFQYAAPPVKTCHTAVTLHDVLYEDFPENFPFTYRLPRRLLFSHSARQADVVATVSDYSRGRIMHHYGVENERIVLTPNAVTEEFFMADRAVAGRRTKLQGIRPYLLNVSRIEPRKNQLALVRAYHRLGLAERGYDLVLVNRRSIAVPELEAYIVSLPEEERRRIHRFDGLPHEELPAWYAGAELFVYPSLGEGFGIPPLEAAAAGVPVICHNATAMADFDFFGQNLIDVTAEGALENAIERNLTSPPAEADLARIRETVRERYSWRRAAEQLLRAIREPDAAHGSDAARRTTP